MMEKSNRTESGDREQRDTLTEVLQAEARKLLAQALEPDLDSNLQDSREASC